MKVDYRDGGGTGNILWKLGQGGDFKLQGAVDPTDWFYAQHDVNFVSSNTTGSFKLAVMDNGDNRLFPSALVCNAAGAPVCYTTVPIMQVDENAKTVSFLFHHPVPTQYYSSLPAIHASSPTQISNTTSQAWATVAYVLEKTPTETPQTVWKMYINTNTYRAYRMPSLYPAFSGKRQQVVSIPGRTRFRQIRSDEASPSWLTEPSSPPRSNHPPARARLHMRKQPRQYGDRDARRFPLLAQNHLPQSVHENSSPCSSSCSVTPSVNIVRKSPGSSGTTVFVNCASGKIPTMGPASFSSRHSPVLERSKQWRIMPPAGYSRVRLAACARA